MQWQSCRKENEFPVLIITKVTCFAFLFSFFFSFIFKGESELINTNLEQVFYCGVFFKADLIYCT